ncbi:MAG: formate--tetrahydrofolate ligase, partial [Mesorhizobium sp.]
AAAVIVATVRAMKMNGGVKKEDLGKENIEAVKKGCLNLGRHIENVHQFGVPVVVAINHFTTDTEAEIRALKDFVASMGADAILCKHWAQGSAGIEDLAHRVVKLAESGASQFSPLYPDEMPLFEKVNTIVKRIYRGDEAIADKSIRDQLHAWEQAGYGNLPVCMAKTQYSFSTDPNLRGAPTGHTVPVREVRLSAGAGFVVIICGEIMTMPGLPKAPSSEKIFLNEQGQIEGLF